MWQIKQINNTNKLFGAVKATFMRVLFVFLLIATPLANVSADDVNFQSVLKVYSISPDRTYIGDVKPGSKYNTLSRNGSWRRVQFLNPTVPAWVSEKFVLIDGGIATVDAGVLNVRISPSIDSSRLTQVNKGYTSKVLKRENGFVQILMPASLNVFVNDSELKSAGPKATASGSKSSSAGQWLMSGKPESLDHEAIPPTESPDSTVTAESSGDDEIQATEELSGSPVAEKSQQEILHQIAPGDAISLVVFGENDLSAENLRVPQGGRVSFPLIGVVPVIGKTTTEVEEAVRTLLSEGYVKKPSVSVSIFSYRPIFIRGEVPSTGSFPYNEGLTVGTAIDLAGGAKATARADGVSILRGGKVVAKDLSLDSQQKISSGDVISVAADQAANDAELSYIYLQGEVVGVGEYEYRSGLTVEKAIVIAGGLTLRASRRKITITRYAERDEKGAPLKLRRVKLFAEVRPGDIINVGASWF